MKHKMNLNNGKEVLEDLAQNGFQNETSIVRIQSGSSSRVNITDQNVKNNSEFIANLFDSLTVESSAKLLTKKIKDFNMQ